MILLILAIVGWFAPQLPSKSPKKTEVINNWEYEKKQAQREHEAERNKEWFKKGRWLTDKEIDWAGERMEKEPQMPGSFPGQPAISRFKILPAYQFCYVAEIMRKREKGWELAFKELLKELTDFGSELVFIPVNQTNYHWSLLIYEGKSKCFWHWDTLWGANWNYAKDLVYELLKELEIPNHQTGQHFLARHKIRQNNGFDCGVAVVALIKRIRERYEGEIKNVQLGKFDFQQERKRLRNEYLKENN